MYKIFVILFIVFLPYVANCANDAEYRTATYDEMQQRLLDDQSASDVDFETLRRSAIEQYPQLENELIGVDDEAIQAAIIRGFLAYKTFEWYKQYFFSQLYAASATTGRIVRQSITDNRFDNNKHVTGNQGYVYGRYWLDGGIMDSEECEWDFDKKRACDYPDGFEEFVVIYSTSSGGTEMLDVIKDDKQNNQHVSYDIRLVMDENIQPSHAFIQYYISIGEDVTKYNEWHKWRNDDAADIRNGKFVRVKGKRDKDSPFGTIRWEADMSRDWKSNWLPTSGVRSMATENILMVTQQ